MTGYTAAGGYPIKIYTPPGQRSLFSRKTGTPSTDNADTRSLEFAGGAMHGPALFSLKAHHGTPHKVDRFTTDKIGTGEGAQVYGWGLYFAENPKVARDYATTLARRRGDEAKPQRVLLDGKEYGELSGALTPDEESALYEVDSRQRWWNPDKVNPLDKTEQELAKTVDNFHRVRAGIKAGRGIKDQGYTERDMQAFLNAEHTLKWLRKNRDRIEVAKAKDGGGNTYTVKLRPDPDELMDWEKPLSEQSEKVKSAFRQAWQELGFPNRGAAYESRNPDGQSLYASLAASVGNKAAMNHPAWMRGTDIPSEKTASEFMAKLGIKGIRFLDQGSRGTLKRLRVVEEAGKFKVVDETSKWEHTGWLDSKADAEAIAAKNSATSNYVIFDDKDIAITHENGQELTPEQAAQQPMFSRKGAAAEYLGGDKPGADRPERERSAAEVKADVEQAENVLQDRLANRGQGAPKDEKQAIALATAKYRTLRDELLSHPDYVAEQLADQHAAVTEANAILKPLGKAVHPEEFPNPNELREKLPADQFKRLQELQNQIEQTHAEIARMPKKLVSRVYADMQDDGRLPKSATPIETNAGRTLAELTRKMGEMKSDSPKQSIMDRLAIGRRAADAVTGIKDFATRSAVRAMASWRAGVDALKSAPPVDDDYRTAKKAWIFYDTRTQQDNFQYAKALVERIPNLVRRKAISVWLDADGDRGLLQFQRDAVPEEYLPIWDAALKLTASEKHDAQLIRQNFEKKADDAITAGLLEKGRENYGVPQRWKTPPQIEGDPTGEARAGSAGNPFAKLDVRSPFWSLQRKTASYFEGIMHGGEPENLDVAHLVTVYDQAFHKTLGSRAWVGALQEASARDGMPVVKISGKASSERNATGTATFVDPRSAGTDAVTEDGRPYRSVDHPALKEWKFVSKDADGNPILVKGDMLIHPDYYDDVKNELETPRWQTKAATGGLEKAGYYALKTSSFLKASKFIGPFHIVTEALHAMTHGAVGLVFEGKTSGLNPSVKGFEIDLADPTQALLARNMSLGFGHAREMFEEGLSSAHGGIWGYIPGLGQAIVRMNHFTFNDFIPRLKMKQGLEVYRRNLARYSKDTWEGKKLNPEQIAELTGRQMDAAFGGQNWRLIGAHKNTLAMLRMGLVAPDFLISRAKVVGQAFKPYGQEQRRFLMMQAAGVYFLTRVLNTIFSDDHDPHFELKNWDAVVIGKRAYHARFLVSDAANLARDLMGFGSFSQHGIPFITGRLGVVPKIGMEVTSGKDLFTGGDKDGLLHADNPALKAFAIGAADVAEWMTPMGVDGFLPNASAKGNTGLGSAIAATVGVSSRKETATGDIWDLARKFNLHGNDPKAVKFQTDRDGRSEKPSDYRALDNLLDAGDTAKAREAYNKLIAGGRSPQVIAARYDRSIPFTGNQAREATFIKSLDAEQQKTYQRARAEQQARRAAFQSLLR